MKSLFTIVGIFCLSAGLTAAFAEDEAKGKKAKAPEAKKVMKEVLASTKEKKQKKNKKDALKETRSDGLVIEDVMVGEGIEAKLGSKITVFYRGTLKDGKEFDSNMGGEPITFELEEGRLIKGWTEGIPGMKVGGKRKLSIPYQLAYGEQGTPGGPIPPKADLNFEIELKKVE